MATVTLNPVTTAKRDLWAEAAATLSDKEKKILNAENSSKGSISSSVLQMAEQKKAESDKKLWSFSFHGQKILIRDVLQHILDWTKKFEQVAEFVVGLDVSGHAAIPWSAIKFFLDVAGKSFEKSGAMLLGMEFVTREISFYTIFEVLYLKKPSDATEILSQSLIKTYAKLLSYLARAKEYYSDNTFKQIMKAPFDDGGVDDMMKDIADNRTLIQENAHLIDKQALDEGLNSMLTVQNELKEELENWKVPLESISTKVTEINDATRLAKVKEILRWLSLIQFEMHHQRAKDGLLQDSGRWLLDHNDFRQWKEFPKSILWLRGILGSGKTKLSALIVETVTNTTAGDLDPVAYFYCMRDSAEPERANPAQILRCIVRQFAYDTTASAIRPAVLNKYEELTEGGIRDGQLDLDQSATLIVDLTEGLASATIIIDGMDECEDILTLLGKLGWILERAKIPIRIFISSRIEKNISIGLENLPTSTIEIGENSGDIGLFVRTEVETAISKKSLLSGKISLETKQRIIETLTAGAQGMFWWASLQLESLKKLKNEENVIKELSKLPPTLSETYAQIYNRMSETDTFQIAVRALSLLACSQKPLAASAFLTAVCPPPQKAIDSESLLDYCFNLVVKDEALGIFRFAHLSVREYLETRDDYTTTSTHAVASEICLTYITKTRVGARNRITAQNAGQTLDTLFEYATMFWPLHCGLSGKKRDVPPLAPLILSFIMQRRIGHAFTEWMKDARSLAKYLGAEDRLASQLRDCFCSPPNPFFLACTFGIHEVVESSSVSITAWSESGYSGLHLASMYGHEQVVQVLLKKGAGADSKDRYGRTPLYYAARNGNPKVIEVLFDHDKDITISPEILVEAAYSQAQEEGNILEQLLSRYGKSQIPEDVLQAAIMARTKVLIQCLWNLQPEFEISQELFDKAAFYHSFEVLDFMLAENDQDKFTITIKTLSDLARGWDTRALELILPLYKGEPPLPKKVIGAAALFGGLKPLKVLVDYDIEKGFETQITQDIFKVAAKNAQPDAIKLVKFLQGLNPNLQITTEVILSAAGNKSLQQALQLVQYFHAQNPEAEITEAVVRKAICNGNCGLLNYLSDIFKELKVTRELVEIAAKSGTTSAFDMVDLLLTMNPEIQVDEALLNLIAPFASKQAMAALFDRSKGCNPTEEMLLNAATLNGPDTVEFLITKSPGLQITDAIIIAYIKARGDEDYCKEVLEVFCDNAKDFKPTEEIAIAAVKSCNGREFLGYLITRYGSVPITDSVWQAATCNWENPSIEFLLDQDFKPPQDKESITASMAVLGLVDVVERLSQAWNEVDSEKWLSVANLCCAINDSDEEEVQELISEEIWLGAKHQWLGWTPLWMAVRACNEEIVEILLQTGKVELETRAENGKTPLCQAAEWGSEGVVKMLLEAGADPKAADSTNATPLSLAASMGNEETVQILLQTGKVELETKNEDGKTPLCSAAERGHEGVVKVLLEAGANSKAVDSKNATPEMLAAANNHLDICELLQQWEPHVAG